MSVPVVTDPQTSGNGVAMSRLVAVPRRDSKKRCMIISDQYWILFSIIDFNFISRLFETEIIILLFKVLKKCKNIFIFNESF